MSYSMREGQQGSLPLAARKPLPSWKRILDVLCILLALPVILPLGVLIALFIKLVSPGPAFFRQQRVGTFGKRFMCLKFRTMKIDADTSVHQDHLKHLITSNHPTQKLDCSGDKRLIMGGLLLRALGLDELPQLINVLRGEMSLVGPRPCTPFEFDLFLPRRRPRAGASLPPRPPPAARPDRPVASQRQEQNNFRAADQFGSLLRGKQIALARPEGHGPDDSSHPAPGVGNENRRRQNEPHSRREAREGCPMNAPRVPGRRAWFLLAVK